MHIHMLAGEQNDKKTAMENMKIAAEVSKKAELSSEVQVRRCPFPHSCSQVYHSLYCNTILDEHS